jgi:hypothetical protein
MQHIRIVPSPHELAAAEVQVPEHVRPMVAAFGTRLGASDDHAIADGVRAIRAGFVVARRLTHDDRPLAFLQERRVTAYLTCGAIALVVVPVPVRRYDVHDTTMLVALDDPDQADRWRFLLNGTRLVAVDLPETPTA